MAMNPLTQEEIEEQRKFDRLRAQLDRNTRNRELGFIEGYQKGLILGSIRICEKLLKLPVTPFPPLEELFALGFVELDEKLNALEEQVGKSTFTADQVHESICSERSCRPREDTRR